MSPLAAAVAIAPDALVQQPAIWMLAGMVLAWVTGFDVLYALQDVQVDRTQGLHSMPSVLGPATAIWISRILHVAAIALLVLVYVTDARLHVIFLLSVGAAAALLLWEHLLIARYGTERITLAFFTLNGIVSCALVGAMGIIDRDQRNKLLLSLLLDMSVPRSVDQQRGNRQQWTRRLRSEYSESPQATPTAAATQMQDAVVTP